MNFRIGTMELECLILGMGDGIIKSNLTISAKIRDRLEYLLIYLSYLLQQFSLPVAIATPLWAHCCQTFDVDSGPGASYFTFDRQKETHWKCLAILNYHLVMGKKKVLLQLHVAHNSTRLARETSYIYILYMNIIESIHPSI